MQPETPNQPPLLILDYHDPSNRPRVRAARLARVFAGILSLAAIAMGYGAIEQGWVENRVLGFGVILLFAAGANLALRSANRCRGLFRGGWIGAVVVFGLWTTAVLSNQFHGAPPPSDRYYIAGFGVSFVLSAFALTFDPGPRGAT
jgi:hypothetical protein